LYRGANDLEMLMRSERIEFANANGEKLAAVLDVRSAGIAHCFTCGKDFRTAKRISEQLTTFRADCQC
jgi:hypothetical protein